MSKLLSRLRGFFKSRTLVGMDKGGNRYFTRTEEMDGTVKEKRWVIFKGEEDPTSIPVEWICWLSGQRKKAPTPQEMIDMEMKRERVKLNVALLKNEERKSKHGSLQQGMRTGTVGPPDLRSFIQQFPGASLDENRGYESVEVSDAMDGITNQSRAAKQEGLEDSFQPQSWRPPSLNPKATEAQNLVSPEAAQWTESSEPTGSGESFKPGTWQPPP
eukprot:TRINITY_DN9077_c0_g1_i1.p1 TRINITY_DN9077_c0_g1~~TRINITY_DN9077_c0_g1_i1.p1  ORF type:complete len:216 (+),score=49.96 TRINITY_DN9077_c0_g1_i1:130-777(+)